MNFQCKSYKNNKILCLSKIKEKINTLTLASLENTIFQINNNNTFYIFKIILMQNKKASWFIV